MLDIKQNGVLDYEELKVGGYVVDGKLHPKYTSFEERKKDDDAILSISPTKTVPKSYSANDLASLDMDEKFVSSLDEVLRSQQILNKSVDDLDMLPPSAYISTQPGTPKIPNAPLAPVLTIEYFLGKDTALPPAVSRNGSAPSNGSGRARAVTSSLQPESPLSSRNFRVGSVGMEYDSVSEIDIDSDEDCYDEDSVRDLFSDDEEDRNVIVGEGVDDECEMIVRTPLQGEHEYINVMHSA